MYGNYLTKCSRRQLTIVSRCTSTTSGFWLPKNQPVSHLIEKKKIINLKKFITSL